MAPPPGLFPTITHNIDVKQFQFILVIKGYGADFAFKLLGQTKLDLKSKQMIIINALLAAETIHSHIDPSTIIQAIETVEPYFFDDENELANFLVCFDFTINK